MLAFLGLITGLAGPISAIAGKLSDLGIARAQAQSNEEIKRVDAEIEEAHDRRAILVAEAGNRIAGAINATVRLCMAAGPILYILKYFAWDKVIGSFVGCAGRNGSLPGCETFATDGLNAEMAAVLTACVALYLGYNIAARFKR